MGPFKWRVPSGRASKLAKLEQAVVSHVLEINAMLN
jgi:hypothetical protein